MSVSDYKAKVTSYLLKAKYRFVELCLQDIMQAVPYIQGSIIKLEKFYFDNGKSRDLIVINSCFVSTNTSNR